MKRYHRGGRGLLDPLSVAKPNEPKVSERGGGAERSEAIRSVATEDPSETGVSPVHTNVVSSEVSEANRTLGRERTAFEA